MQVTLQNPEPQSSNRRASAITIIVAAIVLSVVAASVWFLFEPLESRKAPPAGETANPKMSPLEQQYVKNIEIANIQLSRAENFLHQEVTTVSGEIHNGGSEPVSSLRLTTEFFDELNQVVLRETRGVLGTPERALAPGERREFEISFEHVPTSWNMQQPAVRVSYLKLPNHK